MKNSLYHDTLMYSQSVPNVSGDRDHNIAIWSADHGAAMRAALNRATDVLAAMLACDLNAEPGAQDNCKADGRGFISRLKNGTMNYVASAP